MTGRHGRAVRSRVAVVTAAIVVLAASVATSAPAAAVTAGELDPSFGSDGKVLYPLGQVSDLALQADGSVVAMGNRFNWDIRRWQAVVARLTPQGAPDPSFGQAGEVVLGQGSSWPRTGDVAVQPDGRIVVGWSDNEYNFAVARLEPSGAYDGTFGTAGRVVTRAAAGTGQSHLWAVALQDDGKIVAVGDGPTVVVRYTADGKLDSTFGTGGIVSTSYAQGSTASSVAVQDDGKIVVGGAAITSATGQDFVVSRLNADGTPDAAFGSGGAVLTPLAAGYDHEEVYDVAVQPDGRIVAAGYTRVPGTQYYRFAVVRYTPEGALDLSFDGDGILTPRLATTGLALAVALQADGKVLVGGRLDDAGNPDAAVIRLRSDGSLDPAFGVGGLVRTHFGGSEDLRDLDVMADGRIVVGGLEQHSSVGFFGRYLAPSSPPVADAGGPYATVEGAAAALSARSSYDEDGRVVAYHWDLDADGAFDDASGPEPAVQLLDDGSYQVQVQVTDDTGLSAADAAVVTVANAPPTATLVLPVTPVAEGSAFTVSLVDATDPSPKDMAAGLRFSFDCGEGAGWSAPDTSSSTSCTAVDDPSQQVQARVLDQDHGTSSYGKALAVANVSPTLRAVTTPTSPVLVGASASVSASFTDPGVRDTHTASVDWGDGVVQAAVVNGGTVAASHIYAAAGLYDVTVTVADDDGGTAAKTSSSYVVVYDPDGGWLSGRGTVPSPAGAYPYDPDVSGDATFALSARYRKGSTEPSGRTSFDLDAAGFHFAAVGYDWLVVSRPRTYYRGWGTVNGSGRYEFLVSTVDGGRSGDRFRLKVWEQSGVVLYDSQPGDREAAPATTALTKGGIALHR